MFGFRISSPYLRVLILSYTTGLASTYPEPENKRKWLQDQLYNYNYDSALPTTWQWPQNQSEPIKLREIEPLPLYKA